MYIISPSDCIKCHFSKDSQKESEYVSTKTEIFFGETESIESRISYLKKYITIDEQLRADKFYSDIDRKTYISCHAILRLVLSSRLNINPLDLEFIKGPQGKPGLTDNHAFFNIAHTREAFVIAFARDFPVGIDLEKIRDGINIHSVSNTYFSNSENEFMQKSEKDETERFFMLWTRKEAMLKAIGSGIINNLSDVNVSEPINFLKKESFNGLGYSVFDKYYVYSLKQSGFYLSLAIPQQSSICIYKVNEDIVREINDEATGKFH
jgi:4'-phosphopantetheinyl transferase